jgi:hypothetical protein
VRRDQLEHIIRASAAISGDDEIVIVGSQAIIDGSIGELSTFHDTFGYYAQGVAPETATLPPGWQERLVPVRSPATRGATGWCLEIHDLVLSKYVAGREKDDEFCQAAVAHGLVDRSTLEARLASMTLAPALRSAVLGRIAAHCG